jgi:hypothetical protein
MAAKCHAEAPRLVANWSSTHLYAEEVSCIGRLWSLFYKGAELFGYKDLKQEKLVSAANATCRIFREIQQEAVLAQESYQAALLERIKGEEVPEERFHAARTTLTSWQSITSVWTIFLKSKESKGLQDYLKELSSEDSTSLLNREVLADLREFYSVIALEGCLQEPLPVLLLRKLSCSEELTKIEEITLEVFISRINNYPHLFVRTFGHVLRSCVKLFKVALPESYPNSIILKMALIFRGCMIFMKNDQKHQEWVRRLKPGDKVRCNGQEHILGGKIEGNGENGSLDVNFTVQEDPSKKISFAINRELMELRKYVSEEFSWGIRPLKYIDHCRHFAVMESIVEPLASIEWDSNTELSEHDRIRAEPIANLFRWLVDEQRGPSNISLDSVGFNGNGVLRQSKLVVKGSYNFDEMVRYILKCANGNRAVFKCLIKPIHKHPYACFYRNVVKNCFSESPYSLNVLTQAAKVPRDVQMTSQLLQDSILELKSNLAETLSPHIVAGAILKCYNDGAYVGLLPENFRQEVEEVLSPLPN